MSMPKQVRFVKILKSPVKIKEEIIEDDYNIPCRLCTKSFANEYALKNHLRMEHSGEEVDITDWVNTAMQNSFELKKKVKTEIESDAGQMRIAKKTAELVSSMQPTDIMSLASKDISYIIIKAEDGKVGMEKVVSRKRERDKRPPATPALAPAAPAPAPAGAPRRQPAKREREREIVPIAGPFECLQPSTLVADGTCHQIFFSCCDYSIHFRDEHTRRRKAIKCQVCEKVLASSIGEEATTPYPCHVCGVGFESSKELSAHVNTAHVKLKPFECAVCHKRFTQQGGVHQHMRMHTGDRPFPCTFCPKSFTQKSGLDQHLRTHTKVKPYRCVICSKSFIQSVHLKQHMRTHTNVSPFQCAICEKRFKQSSHLNYHLKHHSEANMTDDQKKKYQELIGMITEQNLVQVEIGEETVMMEEGDGEGEGGYQAAGGEGEGEGEEYIISYVGEDETEMEVIEEEGGGCGTGVAGEGEGGGEGEGEEGEDEDGEGEDGEGEVVVEQDDREYILSDNGNETWSVKIVSA